MERQPWECPRCHKVIAPHMDEHDCDPDDGGAAVPAKRPVVPSAPGAVSYATTSGSGQVTVTITGAVIDGRQLAGAVLSEMRRYARRNAGVYDLGSARRRREGGPVRAI